MEIKTEKCKDCIYFEDPMFSLDCDSCVKHSNFLSHEQFNEDMQFWHGDYEATEPEENKAQYFLIKWLIVLLLEALAEEMTVCFSGIVHKPVGEKCSSEVTEYLPFWLKPFFLKAWCNQWRNGGYTGDDFAGSLYFRILPFVYLKYEYQC